jgi:hypothetical protein
MRSSLHTLLVGALLMGMTVWAGAKELAPGDKEVPAPLAAAPVAAAAADAGQGHVQRNDLDLEPAVTFDPAADEPGAAPVVPQATGRAPAAAGEPAASAEPAAAMENSAALAAADVADSDGAAASAEPGADGTAVGNTDAASGQKPAAEGLAAVDPEAGPATARSGSAADRLELDATSIRGNQELPRVLYIVPWKDPELGDLVGKPVNSLVDEALAPVDREVFRRQIRYFDQLYGDAGETAAGP